jgi:DNA-binding phage protein
LFLRKTKTGDTKMCDTKRIAIDLCSFLDRVLESADPDFIEQFRGARDAAKTFFFTEAEVSAILGARLMEI